VVAVIGLRGEQSLRKVGAQVDELYRDEFLPTLQLAETLVAFHHLQLRWFDMVSTAGDSARYATAAANADATLGEMEELLQKYAAENLDDVEVDVLRPVQTDLAQVRAAHAALRQSLENQNVDIAVRRADTLNVLSSANHQQLTGRLCTNIRRIADIQEKHAGELLKSASAVHGRESRLFLIIVAGTVLLAIVLGVSGARGITNPLTGVIKTLEDVARGDLRLPQLDVARKDEIGQLARTLTTTIETQRRVIGEIRDSSSQVASSADEISASAVQITKGAENQSSATDQTSSTMVEMATQIDHVARSAQGLASNVEETSTSIQQMSSSIEEVAKNAETLLGSVEETSSTIEQMTASIRSVAGNVKTVDEASREASRVAQNGGQELSGVINRIGASSGDITKIVRIIEEIADQTNLLALNAAIEAARAGDAGKGFAVVAEEVKRLADRSVASTREISGVVERVQRDVVQAVDLSNGVLRQIVEAVAKSSALVGEVHVAVQEQSGGASQILKTAGSMQHITRQLATAVKEQAEGTRQIMKAVSVMNKMTQQVAEATGEQKNGGDMVVKAVEQISRVAQQNVAATEQLSKATNGLAREADRMRNLAQAFAI
jgi:methyl-accepting chemotaxis protein